MRARQAVMMAVITHHEHHQDQGGAATHLLREKLETTATSLSIAMLGSTAAYLSAASDFRIFEFDQPHAIACRTNPINMRSLQS